MWRSETEEEISSLEEEEIRELNRQLEKGLVTIPWSEQVKGLEEWIRETERKKLPPKEKEEVLILTDESVSPRVLPKLKKRSPKTKFDKKKEKIGKFKFLESDEESEWTTTSEESFEEGIEVDDDSFLSRKDQEALYDALQYLEEGRWEDFLNDPFIIRFFRPVQAVIESCGRAAKKNKTQGMWLFEWAGKLKIKKLKKPIFQTRCISCAENRALTYEVYDSETGEHYGYIGSVCYERFKILSKLVKTVKKAAKKIKKHNIQPGTANFDFYVTIPIIKARGKVMKIPAKIAKYYKK